ncbi:MAG TPA: hypothetical protein DEG71_08040, partial [Clostridiales bacterium]|nr:hypothetical protein [Clostridiales bacterium]
YSSNTNALGNTITYEREPVFGNILKEKNILGHETIYNYDNNGNLKQATYPNAIVYTELKWNTQIADPNQLDEKTELFYKRIVGSNAPDVIKYYNKYGQELRTEIDDINGKKVCTKAIYNPTDLSLNKNIKPYFSGSINENKSVKYSYDNLKRLTKVEDENKTIKSYTYDGRKTTESINGEDYTKTINELGQLVEAKDKGGLIQYKYNSQGLPRKITYNDNHIVALYYDINGNRTKIVDPNAGTITNEYNSFNQVTKQTDAKGNVTEYKYDDFGRILEVKAPNNRIITYDYNKDGNGIEQIKSIELKENDLVNHKESYDYDTYGRVIKVTTIIKDNTYERSFVYDLHGNLTEETTPSGLKIVRHYNSKGFNTKVTATDENNKSYNIWEFGASEADGRIVNYKMGKDNMIDRTYNYDSYGYLSRITSNVTKNNGGQKKIQDFTYAFNEITGNIISRTSFIKKNNVIEPKTEIFSYDELDRLTKVDNNIISYNINGNIEYKSDIGTYEYDATKLNAVTKVTPKTPKTKPISINDQYIEYTTFGKVSKITEDKN